MRDLDGWVANGLRQIIIWQVRLRVGLERAWRWLSQQCVENLSRGLLGLVGLFERVELSGLDFEEAGFHGRGAAQPPQQTGEAQYQFPLDGRLCVIVRDDGGLEGSVIIGIFQRTDNGLGGQAMTDGIAAGAPLAVLAIGTGASSGVAAIGLDLLERGHRGLAGAIGFVL